MIGQSLGRFRIVDTLGEGGMGVVYRAEDPRLERDVAIKVLSKDALRDAEASQRLRREARALSRLLHPNIATLFDFDSDGGVDFLVLEFVRGETLAKLLASGPLPEARARAIALEIADALEAAHDQGIVHRDLKPANVVLTPRGRAKVLDFGLARLRATPSRPASTVPELDVIAGTIPYMAPEQIKSSRADPRTDLYALGVMLFEMTTGRLPFVADDVPALLYRIAHEAPPRLRDLRPGMSAELEAIVTRCLEKDPEHRFSDARALANALREPAREHEARKPSAAAASAAVPSKSDSSDRIRSIAVLPLANRSGDADQEFFTDGMTDALIADLAQIGGLRVISRTSAMQFKNTKKSLPEIATELGVDAVVEGSVLRAGERVRVTCQLIEAATDRTLWAKSYERDITDILSLQSEVARHIAEGIRVRVTPDEQARLAPRGPVNPAAHVAYLQGRYLWNRWSTEALKESIARYEEALAADPRYALAWAGLADSYSVLGNTNALPPFEAYPRARDAAVQGLAVDESLAELHCSLGFVHRYYDWDWPRAEREFLRALELNPGYATARRWYAQFLSGLGRHDEAIAEAERALEQDPLSLILYTAVGDVLFYARRYDAAIGYYRRCLEMDPEFGPAHTDLARALDVVGRTEEALGEFRKGAAPEGGELPPSPGLATLLLRSGRRDQANAMMDRVLARARERFVAPYGIASFYSVAGHNGEALDWLERAYEQRDGALVWIKVHPRLDGLREEHRFRELLAKMRLD